MPQSEEHLRILELLGRAPRRSWRSPRPTPSTPTTVELAQLDVAEHLDGLVATGRAGRGVRLASPDAASTTCAPTLDAVLAAAPAPRDHGRPRLWIDRVFAAEGRGHGGHRHADRRRASRVDDELEVVRLAGRAPGAGDRDRAPPGRARWRPGRGSRSNLAGVEHHALGAGRRRRARRRSGSTPPMVDVAVTPVPGEELAAAAARLQADGGLGRARGGRAAGSSDDDTAFARLRFDMPLPLAPGDRLVLRDPARARTVAGAGGARRRAVSGRLVDAADVLARPLVVRLLAGHGWLAARRPARDWPASTNAVSMRCSRDAVEPAVTRSTSAGGWALPADVEALRGRATRARCSSITTADALSPGLELGALAAALRLDRARSCAPRRGLATTLVVEQRGRARAGAHGDRRRGVDAEARRAARRSTPRRSRHRRRPTSALAARALGTRRRCSSTSTASCSPPTRSSRARALLGPRCVERRVAHRRRRARRSSAATRKFVVPAARTVRPEGVHPAARRRADRGTVGLDADGRRSAVAAPRAAPRRSCSFRPPQMPCGSPTRSA